MVNMLNIDRALIDAGPAHRATPKRGLVDYWQVKAGGAVAVEGVAIITGVLAAFARANKRPLHFPLNLG